MAKRYTDSGKWSDDWFSELTLKEKLVYLYILDNCDQIGVWKPNFKLAEFQLGVKIDWAEFQKTMGPNRLLIFDNYWWLRKFCDFQYGKLTEESKSQTTIFYIKLLKKYNLWIAYTEGIYTPKDKEKDKDKEEDKGIVPEKKEEIIPKEPIKEVAKVFEEFLEMRKKIKKPATDYAVKLLKKELVKLAGTDETLMIKIIEQSIRNNWQDLFKLKVDGFVKQQEPNVISAPKNGTE